MRRHTRGRVCERARPSLLTRLRYWLGFERRRLARDLARLEGLAGDDPASEAGVREPRRPLRPYLSGSVALDLPDE